MNMTGARVLTYTTRPTRKPLQPLLGVAVSVLCERSSWLVGYEKKSETSQHDVEGHRMRWRIQLKTEQQLVRRTLHFSPGFERVGIQLRPGVRRACPQDFVLAVDAAEDVPSLDERDDLPFCVFHRPAEGRAHALESNRCERLEIEHDCARADLRRET